MRGGDRAAMVPIWLTAISWVSLGAAFVCAGLILYDMYGRDYRQHMPIMEAVWPVTALYLGPLGLPPLGPYGRRRYTGARRGCML